MDQLKYQLMELFLQQTLSQQVDNTRSIETRVSNRSKLDQVAPQPITLKGLPVQETRLSATKIEQSTLKVSYLFISNSYRIHRTPTAIKIALTDVSIPKASKPCPKREIVIIQKSLSKHDKLSAILESIY